GPRLIQNGIPAVVGMQGNISMVTMKDFLPVFFETLQDDGQIDLAMARARGRIQNRLDGWMPVLFMRLNTGRLLAKPKRVVPDLVANGHRPSEDEPSFENWSGLLRHLGEKQCTPIVGPGVTDHILGSQRDIAQRWAEIYRYPLAGSQRADLPQV